MRERLQAGVGCFVLNERQEVLMVQEGSGPLKGKGTLLMLALICMMWEYRMNTQPSLESLMLCNSSRMPCMQRPRMHWMSAGPGLLMHRAGLSDYSSAVWLIPWAEAAA